MPMIVPVECTCAFFLGILFLGQFINKQKTKRSRLFKICILLVLFTLLNDSMAYIFMGPETPFAFRYIICLLAYAGGSICFFGFSFYCEEIISEKVSLSPWVFRVIRIAMVIWFILIAVEFISGRVVVFENGVEVADNGFPMYIIIYQILVELLTPAVAWVYRKSIGKGTVILLSFFNLAPIIGITAAALFYYDYTFVLAAITLVMISEFLQRRQLMLREAEVIEQREQLREALATAEGANQAKTDFLFSMSHDIRTPMNAITGFTGMAIKHIDDRDKVLDCLEKTQKSGSMLLGLINSVLEVSRIESGQAVLEEQKGDIYLCFSSIDNTLDEMAGSKDISLSFEFGDIINRYVYADFNRCIRVFVNVISNAIKYTPSGGTVTVRCEQTGEAKGGIGTYTYTVTDNGIGMSEEFRSHVFDQFSRENTVTVSGIQGSGLGMSVVKSFVELMGGTVSVQSRQGEGTTVTIVLPFRLHEGESYVDPVSGKSVTIDSKQDTEDPVNLRGRRALLVEDNELNREIAAEILGEEGITVEEAEDGTVAVEMLREKGPDYFDFVLMDIQMPLMNGYEATKKIREMYPDKAIPIIALSANAFAEDRAASIAAGMNDHVAKPINIENLFTVLSKHLAG